MDRKELLRMRKDVSEEIETTKAKLARLKQISENLKKEETPVIENHQGFIDTCSKFINGEIEESKVSHDLQKFNNKANQKTEIETILIDLDIIQKDLQRELQEKNESLKSIEKGLWRFVFEELKAKLHDQSRSLIEETLVSAINARVCSDFNFIFNGLFGKYQRTPAIEKMKEIEKAIKREWDK